MKLKDRIGAGISNFLYPYIQNQYRMKGDYMKMPIERDQYLLEEKYLWFLGCEDLLADFYQTKTHSFSLVDTRAEYYYSNVGTNVRIVHSGLPSLISYSKARLLMSGGLELLVTNGDKEDKKTTELLNAIYDDNKMNTLIKESVVTESWGKKFAWKISNDSEASDYPIVELYKPQNYRSVYKRGRLFELIFLNEYKKDDTTYRLEETYGKGYITYKLFQCNKMGNDVPANLEDLEETAGLEDVTWKTPRMLAGEKVVEKSDYDGIIGEFDALDEAWSQLMDEIRLGRSEMYVPEMLLTNRTFNKFRKNYAVLGNDERETGKNEVKHVQPDIRSEQYANTISLITNNCLMADGLSPFTVGIQDEVGSNASGYSMTKREATSLRTRNEMMSSWEEFLDDMLDTVLFANNLFNGTMYNEKLEVKTSFGNYISPTRKELIEEVKLMVDAEMIDKEKALDEVYGDEIDENEKIRILNNLGSIAFEETPIEE